MCVCSHSSSVQSAFLSAFPPGQTSVCVCLTALDRDQHKQNISLETKGLIACGDDGEPVRDAQQTASD